MSLEWRHGELFGYSKAMASPIMIRAWPSHDAGWTERVMGRALSVFDTVDVICTRFRPESPLMRINRVPFRWHFAPPILFQALLEASWAYQRTHGRFDPRVLTALLSLGYTETLSSGAVLELPGAWSRPMTSLRGRPWRPRFRYSSSMVLLGPHPVELGGIGKGLAIRWAASLLAREGEADSYLISAGGDCACRGSAPDGGPWQIGVEDPGGGPAPLAVLGVRDLAVATSSTRLRRWQLDSRPVHHLLNPATGRPGGRGLASVTVVHSDPAVAEVWSKSLFLEGARAIGRLADQQGLAALWIADTGRMHVTSAMERFILWRAPS